MRLLRLVCLMLVRWGKQVCLLPAAVGTGFRHWRRHVVPNQAEAERLDRIRNPSKYLGKS
jgi:hypothetical protein